MRSAFFIAQKERKEMNKDVKQERRDSWQEFNKNHGGLNRAERRRAWKESRKGAK